MWSCSGRHQCRFVENLLHAECHSSDDDKRCNKSFSHPSNHSQLSKKHNNKKRPRTSTTRSHHQTRLITSPFHLCTRKREKKICTWIIYAFRNISALHSFLGRYASRFSYTSLIHLQIKPLRQARKCLLIDRSLKRLSKYCDRFFIINDSMRCY